MASSSDAPDIQNLSPSELFGYLSTVSLDGAADVLFEAGIDGKSFLSLSRDDIVELLPGTQTFFLRKKVFSHIKEQTEGPEVVEVGSSPRLRLPSVEFSLYGDSELIRCNREGRIDTETRERCVRAIISNMIAACQPHNRFPTNDEILEMAIAMCRRYPVLNDDKDLNPEKPWEGFMYKLKRRLSNKKPVSKPQGPTPKKAKVKLPVDATTTQKEPELSSESTSGTVSEENGAENLEPCDDEKEDRHEDMEGHNGDLQDYGNKGCSI